MGIVMFGTILLLTLWIASHLRSLGRNYRAARGLGVPLIICPYDPDSVAFALLSSPLRPFLERALPSAVWATMAPSFIGWEFRDKGAIHRRLGPVFVLVTTGSNKLVCVDAALAQTFLTRRRDFVHTKISVDVMGMHGPNIITATEDAWSRQRRIVASALNERISSNVWRESIDQASSLAHLLLSPRPQSATDRFAETLPGLRSIAINVLCRIAYGDGKPFSIWAPLTDPKAAMSYVDAIAMCTDLVVAAAFVPRWILKLPVMPPVLQTLVVALKRLPDLTKDMLEQERLRIFSSADDAHTTATAGSGAAKKAPETIMTTLLRLSDQAKQAAAARGDKSTTTRMTRTTDDGISSNKTYLSEPEIQGNLFVFTAAGFDTTANTMAYAVTLLAAYPQWQTWIQAEIDAVSAVVTNGGGQEGPDPMLQLLKYAETFPKLNRCMAVMLETLRLYPAVSLLVRNIRSDQTITLPGPPSTDVVLKGPFEVQVNLMGLQTSPEVWGADALQFNPARWLRPDPEALGSHVLMTPPRGTFIPWSIGPRVCPGQKMAQVEFVAVMMTLFGCCSVRPIPKNGETVEQASRRLVALTEDSQPVLTNQMNRPREVCLEWTRR